MVKKVVLTQQGLKDIQDKLDNLIGVVRPQLAEELARARAHGDLSENAEYDEAKNAASRNEGEIERLQQILTNYELVDENELDLQTVNIGTTVKILDKDFGEEEEYSLVGTAEENIHENKISNESPVGRALFGKKVGDTVKVELPGKKTAKIKILEIRRQEKKDKTDEGKPTE